MNMLLKSFEEPEAVFSQKRQTLGKFDPDINKILISRHLDISSSFKPSFFSSSSKSVMM